MAFEGPGRSRARRESRRCCPEARRPPRPGSPTPVPQGWRQRAAPARARLSSPSGALRSRRLQPAGSGSTSSTRPSTSDRRGCHVCLHAHSCPMFRISPRHVRARVPFGCRLLFTSICYTIFRRVLWVAVDGFTPLLAGAALARSAAGRTGCGRIVTRGSVLLSASIVDARSDAGAQASAEGEGEAVLRVHGSKVSLSRPRACVTPLPLPRINDATAPTLVRPNVPSQ